ncbi:MAG: acyl-CoA reductase [Bacteroidota bacterium]
MNLSERISAFAKLGDALHSIEPGDKNVLIHNANNRNAWFTPQQCDLALKGICKFLVKDKLERWTRDYGMSANVKKVGVVMAGNIPLVGFHDLLCVLISGHHLAAKPSSQDTVLIRYAVEQLVNIEPQFQDYISFVERLNDVDAVIATGSDNTSRYFEYYFRNKPHVIRKNRTSVAVLHGDESDEQLVALGKDVFSYFGLGCRNVSKLIVPKDYDFRRMLGLWEVYSDVANNHKYVNNYDYNKSILLVNRAPHLDNGFLLLTENEGLVSPISVLYYATSADLKSDKIQCVVSADGVPFGKSQEPELTDYADNVDTLKFLTAL